MQEAGVPASEGPANASYFHLSQLLFIVGHVASTFRQGGLGLAS
jgi:hypothetical protein